jgi:hypothetical protein
MSCEINSPKDWFEALVQASRDGQFPSRDPDRGCRYRCEDGRRCAIGFLIPDEQYSPELEGTGCRALMKLNPGLLPPWLNPETGTMVQSIHDRMAYKIGHGGLGGWDHSQFVRDLLDVPLFAGMPLPEDWSGPN